MYKYSKVKGAEGPLYYFNTDLGLKYYVAFRNYSQNSYPLNNLYTLDFGKVSNEKNKNDSRISSTILQIIIEFLKGDDSVVLHYLCDSIDKRHLYRKRLFSRWFKICGLENWIKYDYDFENLDYNMSFLYNSSRYETEHIQSEILLTLDGYERLKDDQC